MRNELKSTGPAAGGLSGLIYSASGELDRSYTAVHAYNNGELCLTFGPMRLSMGVEAAAELAKHLTRAVAAAGGAK